MKLIITCLLLSSALTTIVISAPQVIEQGTKNRSTYNPLRTSDKHTTLLLEFQYQQRKVPLKVYLPKKANASVILLSHGLGGSREIGAYMATHWADRGFAVVAMQHIGSDDSIWKNVPRKQRFKKLKKGISAKTFFDRTKDVPATIDFITKSNNDASSPLHNCLDLSKVGIGGHSYGAVTSQAAAGQSFGKLANKFTDKRIKAALLLSPSPPKRGNIASSFNSVSIPWMCMTGTKDTAIIRPTVTPQKRKLVYKNLKAGDKYQLVLKDANHFSFSDTTISGKKQRNANHHKVIKALSTAFWETHLLEDQKAKQWLNSNKVKAILQKGDTWEKK